jgi:hypothetical protein
MWYGAVAARRVACRIVRDGLARLGDVIVLHVLSPDAGLRAAVSIPVPFWSHGHPLFRRPMTVVLPAIIGNIVFVAGTSSSAALGEAADRNPPRQGCRAAAREPAPILL